LLAQRVNQILGGQFFTPWDVEQIPEDDLLDLETWQRYERQFSEIRNSNK